MGCVVFRVDASEQIGTGHVMRCLSLADKLSDSKSFDILFVSRRLPDNLCELVEGKGYRTFCLPDMSEPIDSKENTSAHAKWLAVEWETDARQTAEILKSTKEAVDWLVVDCYALDSRWEKYVRPFVKKIIVIDDLADRYHDCDLILDQNYYSNMDKRYNGLVGTHCIKLFGPEYALLRQEFIEARKTLRQRDGKVKRILIFFGGIDRSNETAKTLRALQALNRPEIAVDVVVGKPNKNKEEIKKICNAMPNAIYHCQVDNIAHLMFNADLAICAGGTSTWERCCLGLPSLVITIAMNQVIPVEELAKNRIVHYIGESDAITEQDIADLLRKLIDSPDILNEYSFNSLRLVDGLGTERCIKAINRFGQVLNF